MTPNAPHASKHAAILVLALAGFCVPAQAQQPTQAQGAAIRSACPSDFRANCAGVQPGGPAALACLQQNMAKLSPACRSAVGAVSGAAAAPTTAPAPAAAPAAPATTPAAPAATPSAPATPPAAQTPAAAPPPAAKPPAAARPPVAPPPVAAPPAAAPPMAAPPPAPPPPVVLTPRQEIRLVRQSCGPDVRRLCGNVPLGGGRVIACLRANAASLSTTCRRALMER